MKGKQPLIRTQQTAVLLPGKKIWIFGGHHNPQCRLNDTWFLDPMSFEWRQAKGEEGFNALDNQVSPTDGPAPRASAAACFLNGKIYLYGGHGGSGYARVSFNDLFTFDVETETWEKLVPGNTTP